MTQAEKIRLEIANPLLRRKKIKISEVEEPTEVKDATKPALDLRAKTTYNSSRKNGK